MFFFVTIIIEGVIVGDDESGNIYKSLYINDGTRTLYVGINVTGLTLTCRLDRK